MQKIISSTPTSFLLQTGTYHVEYGLNTRSEGCVIVRKDNNSTFAIATRLANGFDLDLTAPDAFRSLEVQETTEGLQVEFHSSRPWADFTTYDARTLYGANIISDPRKVQNLYSYKMLST
jgi:hypothetical protein